MTIDDMFGIMFLVMVLFILLLCVMAGKIPLIVWWTSNALNMVAFLNLILISKSRGDKNE